MQLSEGLNPHAVGFQARLLPRYCLEKLYERLRFRRMNLREDSRAESAWPSFSIDAMFDSHLIP